MMHRAAQLLAILLGAAIGAFAFFVIVFHWGVSPISDRLMSEWLAVVADKSRSEVPAELKEDVARLIASGRVVTLDSVVTQLISYYDKLINILIIIVAGACTLSVLYIRSVTKSEAEKLAEVEAAKAFKAYVSTIEFLTFIQKANSNEFSKLQEAWLEDLDDVREGVTSRNLKIEKLEEVAKVFQTLEADIRGCILKVSELAKTYSLKDESENVGGSISLPSVSSKSEGGGNGGH